MVRQEYDLLVIGAGPAGSEAATHAAQAGHRVALVERARLGGTCLNYGCDPTDTLLQIAQQLYRARTCKPYGIEISKVQLDWHTAQAYVRKVMREIRGGTQIMARKSLEKQGIHLFHGQAKFVSPHQVVVARKKIRAKRVIIASGVEPVAPPIEGLAEAGFITHEDVLGLPRLPRRMAIIGSGPMAIEFSQLFHRFGVEVMVLEHGPMLLKGEDRQVADLLIDSLTREGIRFETEVEFENITRTRAGKEIRCGLSARGRQNARGGQKGRRGEGTRRRPHKREKLIVDEILVMMPRRPALDSLQLEAAGVSATDEGITIDAMLQTNAPHIWAAGDVTGGPQFSNRASEQGRLAAHNAFAAKPEAFAEPLIPWIISTDPALAHAGKTEEELWNEGIPFRTGLMPLDKLDRALMNDERAGLVKLLVDEDDKILGGHVLARDAGDMVAPIVLAMRAELGVKELAEMILPYPTMAEAVRWAADQLTADEE